MHGTVRPAQPPSARLPASTGLTPAARTDTLTWPGPGIGSATSATRNCSDPPNSLTSTALNWHLYRRPTELPGHDSQACRINPRCVARLSKFVTAPLSALSGRRLLAQSCPRARSGAAGLGIDWHGV